MSVNDYDEDLYQAIEDLVDSGALEKGTPAYGIAQQVIHTGYHSLSEAQRHIYDTVVVPLLGKQEEENEAQRILNSNPD